jgi:hypothetical protein
MRLSNIPFKLESGAYRTLYRALGTKPSSVPYLSGDTFRSLCSRFYEADTTEAFDPSAVAEGELIFCDTWLLRPFLKGPARKIGVPFSLLSHNGDPNIDSSYPPLLPAKLRRLFTNNALVQDPRIVPLPIGLENKRLHYNGVVADFQRLRRAKAAMVRKRPRILSAFTVGTNPEVRQAATDSLGRNPLNDMVGRMNSRAYRRLASAYLFIASPPGNGVDCHRTWEALYLRSVPIVLRSTLTDHFYGLGLPLLVVDSYGDERLGDSAALESIYRELSPRFESPALWFDYWKETIGDKR